jgi:HK97 family phage prohead protease
LPPPTPFAGEDQADFIGRRDKPGSKAGERWTVGASRDLPIEDGDRAWDGPAAVASIFEHAGGDNFDPAKARQGFLIHDAAAADLRGSYKLPIARAGEGGLRVPKSGIRAAASRLPQTDAPSVVLERAQGVIDHYKRKAGMDEDGDGDAKRFKTHAAPAGDDPFEYVMSDSSVDRMGDVIDQAGWELDNFQRNPVALFGHDSRFPIGKWANVAVRDGRLTGRLELMPPVSERLKEIRAAVAAGVLRAVSVGFHSNNSEPLPGSKSGGIRFNQAELVECSLVAVPANPNALAIARAVGISSEGQMFIFSGGLAAKHGRRTNGGGLAEISPSRKPNAMTTVSERIELSQVHLTGLRDQLSEHLDREELDDSAIEDLNTRINSEVTRLRNLERSEKLLGNGAEPLTTAVNTGPRPALPAPASAGARPFAVPKKEEEPGYLIMRLIVCHVLSHITKQPPERILRERYGDDAATRAVFEVYQQRAATVPATATQAGWAAELFQIQYGQFFDALLPKSVYTPLSGQGLRATLGRFGQISMPTRNLTPTIAGSFVAEGAPIPVRQGQFSTVLIGLKKMAVITAYTREMAEHSTPMIEMLLRQQIQDDTSIAVDSVLLDANPATSIRPPGLRNYVTGLTPTAGGGFTALVGDLKQLVGALAAVNSMRSLAWIMNPVQALSIGLTANAMGAFPFQAGIENNMLLGYPVIKSTTQTVGTVVLVDAADYVSLTGDDPRFEVSDQATLHMEDTTPLPIGTPGTPNVVAAPVRSMFQTDSLALRMILPMNWIMRRPVVAWVAAVTW